MTRKKCLIADDDPVSREILSAYMEEKGYSVSTAVNGAEAFVLCKSNTFDCIFVDWEMPVASGITFIKNYIKDALPPSTIIMCSTKDKMAEISEAFNLGVKEYFIKPVKRRELDAKLKNINVI